MFKHRVILMWCPGMTDGNPLVLTLHFPWFTLEFSAYVGRANTEGDGRHYYGFGVWGTREI
jgi:hypothetical protein